MARVEIASQAWGWLVDSNGTPLSNTSATLKNLDGTNATTWTAVSGGSSSTSALTSAADGTLPSFVEEGTYTLTVNAVTRRVEAVSGATLAVVSEAPLNPTHAEYGLSTAGTAAANGTALAAATAATATNGGDIFIPPGAYSYDTSIAPTVESAGGGVIFGGGPGATVLTYTGSDWAVKLGDGGGTETRWQGLRDLSLVGTASAAGGVRINHARFCSLRDVAVTDFSHASGIGLEVVSGVANYFHTVEHCQFRNVPTGVKLAGGSGVGANSNTISDCHFGVHTTAVHIDAGDSNRIIACEFNGSITTGVRIENGAIGNSLLLNQFDQPTTAVNIVSSAVTDTMIVGLFNSDDTISDSGTRTMVLNPLGARLTAALLAFEGTDGSVISRQRTAGTSANVLFAARRSTDTQDRVQVRGEGKYSAGPGGSTAPDTHLERDSAGVWSVQNAIKLTAMAAASVPNNSIFLDSADNVIKRKDNTGAVAAI